MGSCWGANRTWSRNFVPCLWNLWDMLFCVYFYHWRSMWATLSFFLLFYLLTWIKCSFWKSELAFGGWIYRQQRICCNLIIHHCTFSSISSPFHVFCFMFSLSFFYISSSLGEQLKCLRSLGYILNPCSLEKSYGPFCFTSFFLSWPFYLHIRL